MLSTTSLTIYYTNEKNYIIIVVISFSTNLFIHPFLTSITFYQYFQSLYSHLSTCQTFYHNYHRYSILSISSLTIYSQCDDIIFYIYSPLTHMHNYLQKIFILLTINILSLLIKTWGEGSFRSACENALKRPTSLASGNYPCACVYY